MMKKLLFLLLILFPVSLIFAEQPPVPVVIPEEEEEEVSDLILEEVVPETLTPEDLVPSKTNSESKSGTDSIPAADQDSKEAEPHSILQPSPLQEKQTVTKIPAARNSDVSLPSTTETKEEDGELIPFNPGNTDRTKYDTAAYDISDPARLLSDVFQKHQFPYAFIQLKVLSEQAVTRSANVSETQMEIPIVISFDSEGFALFQEELTGVLESISGAFHEDISHFRPGRQRKLIKDGVTLNIPNGNGTYKSYELPKECREVLAQYAALLPVGKVAFYDENRQELASWYFPLLYRDIVKAYPINLLETFKADHQTILILEHQNEPFLQFIQTQASSFVIPENFRVVLARTASAEFLGKFADTYSLEPVFRRQEVLPEIPLLMQVQLPHTIFQSIRFMNCQLMTDRPGETVVKSPEEFVITEEEWAELEKDGSSVISEEQMPVLETP